MKVTEFLKENGLYAKPAYNSAEVKVYRIADDTEAFALKGSELLKTGANPKGSDMFLTPEETIELIKTKLPA